MYAMFVSWRQMFRRPTRERWRFRFLKGANNFTDSYAQLHEQWPRRL